VTSPHFPVNDLDLLIRSHPAAVRVQGPRAARTERHVHSYAQAVLEVEDRTENSIPGTG
jgi:hypothetical protein